MSTTAIVVIVVVAAVALIVVVAGVMMARRASRRRQLLGRFGSEYERAVHTSGSSRQAEADLQARAEERDKLAIRPLNASQRNRYELDWQKVQTEFVDSPALSLGRADALVTDVMVDRGYPMQDFDRQADLISVDHPEVVEHYRRAHEIFVVSLLEADDASERDVPNDEERRSALAPSENASRNEASNVRRFP